MSTKAKATVRLPLQSQKQLSALLAALTPEVANQVGVRSKVAVSSEDLSLLLTVEADDAVALRAALNAYLRWVNSALNVLDCLADKT
jgi:tRNA threonylcarbamoyladenosine modification (KEOPS) complex  Pcc1 subunit